MPRLSDSETVELFRQYRSLAEGRERAEARSRLVDHYGGIADRIARSFRDRGEALEDLRQVAAIGLVNAVDRFSPDRGTKFITFATQTISGEIKRHFRDRSWGLRVPRRLQELNYAVRRASEALAQELGRAPKVQEIAGAVGITEEQALEALELGQRAHDLVSLDELAGHADDDSATGGDRHLPSEGGVDLLAIDLRASLARLEPRLRRILVWRFVGGYSQSEIARRLGISQMHVSRLQARAAERLRDLMQRDEEEGEASPDG